MQSLFKLLKREIRLVTSDHSLLLTFLIAPVLYAFFYGSIYSQKEEKEVKIAVVDADGSSLSRLITQQLDLSEMVEVQSAPTLTNDKYQLHRGAVKCYLYLKIGLEKKVPSLEQAHVVLALILARYLPSGDLLSTI